MTIDNFTASIAFTRNPIMVSHRFYEGKKYPVGSLEIVALEDGDPIFSGCFTAPRLEVDVSEMLDSYASWLPEVTDGDIPVRKVASRDDLFLSGSARITATLGEKSVHKDICFLPGGVSAQNYRKIGPNIFSSRFGASGCNFFMTTRTAGRILAIRETELYPLYFPAGEEETFVFRAPLGGGEYTFIPDEEYGIFALDIIALRRWFVIETHSLPSLIEVRRNGELSCRIIVTPGESSHERYTLKYRNSFGVFELMELAGALSITPTSVDSEETEYRRYDTTILDYVSRRLRTAVNVEFTVDSGVRHAYERNAFIDMLASEEVWLTGYAETPVRVIPSIDSASMKVNPSEPEIFNLKLALCDDWKEITPDITSDSGIGSMKKRRIFTSHFSKQFN